MRIKIDVAKCTKSINASKYKCSRANMIKIAIND